MKTWLHSLLDCFVLLRYMPGMSLKSKAHSWIICCVQGCGVGGKISYSRLRPFHNFQPIPTREHKRNKIRLLKSVEIVVYSKKSQQDSTKVSKEINHFNRNSRFRECDVKNDPSGPPESDKKIRLRLPVMLGIRLHPKTSDSLRLQLRLSNPSCVSMVHGIYLSNGM